MAAEFAGSAWGACIRLRRRGVGGIAEFAGSTLGARELRLEVLVLPCATSVACVCFGRRCGSTVAVGSCGTRVARQLPPLRLIVARVTRRARNGRRVGLLISLDLLL